jgi:hypothetical protein
MERNSKVAWLAGVVFPGLGWALLFVPDVAMPVLACLVVAAFAAMAVALSRQRHQERAVVPEADAIRLDELEPFPADVREERR